MSAKADHMRPFFQKQPPKYTQFCQQWQTFISFQNHQHLYPQNNNLKCHYGQIKICVLSDACEDRIWIKNDIIQNSVSPKQVLQKKNAQCSRIILQGFKKKYHLIHILGHQQSQQQEYEPIQVSKFINTQVNTHVIWGLIRNMENNCFYQVGIDME